MPRKPRFNLPGVPQHVASENNQVAIHACALMTNHVHLLVTPAEAFGITHMMQDIGRKYVLYINRTYRSTGTLWEGWFKASLVAYRELFRHHLHDTQVHAIRDALSQELVLGREGFKDRVEQM